MRFGSVLHIQTTKPSEKPRGPSPDVSLALEWTPFPVTQWQMYLYFPELILKNIIFILFERQRGGERE